MDMISTLKPGIGLLGNNQEEKEYYQAYLKQKESENKDTDDHVGTF